MKCSHLVVLIGILGLLASSGESAFAQHPAQELLEQGKVKEAKKLLDDEVRANPTSDSLLRLRAIACQRTGQFSESVRDYSTLIKRTSGPKASLYQARGVCNFFDAKIAESIADFDSFLEVFPKRAPHHWQRGLCYYYAGQYEKGRKQFEIHQGVNSNDVENAVWHFLCVSKLDGIEAARKNLIPITGDTRIPMKEVQALFSGKGSEEKVLAAARAGDPDKEDLRNRLCYAHLYLGLYWEVHGDEKKALSHLKKSATTHRMDHYMGEVSRVHLKVRDAQRQKEKLKQSATAPLTEERFLELHKSLLPTNEIWKTLPWKTSLLDAQNASAQSGKPIYIWSMDGHPLGCT